MRGFSSSREHGGVAAASSRKWMSVYRSIERINSFEDVGEGDVYIAHCEPAGD